MATSNGGKAESTASSNKAVVGGRLAERYPVNTLWEMTLENQETVSGRVYCTDDFSQSVVLQKPLVHTTLAADVRIVHASSIVKAERLEENEPQQSSSDAGIPLSRPLPRIHKKTLEDREKKATRQAEESFKHINQKASPKGQACFDRLLKACNDVVWKEQSILVLNQVQVDPPYAPETCKIVQRNTNKKSLEDGSLERVRKIVAAVENMNTVGASVASSASAPPADAKDSL